MASTEYTAVAQQPDAAVVGDGKPRLLRGTRAAQLFTADWKSELVLAGYAYTIDIGGITAGGDVALVTGGGNGDVIDSDQPEMAIGTPAGYYHVPLGFTCAVQQDMDVDGDNMNILLFADLDKQIPVPIVASSTVAIPQNLLDGGPASVSRAQTAVETDIADPVCSLILGYATNQAATMTAATMTAIAKLSLNYQPSYPTCFAGPCSVIACFGGIAISGVTTGLGTYTWAEVPVNRFV